MLEVLLCSVVLEPAKEGGYTAYVPSLPGCISEGHTYKEAQKNIKEAMEGWIEVSRKIGDEISRSGVIIG
jgi:predicted RNase H-like HicB family nuclease